MNHSEHKSGQVLEPFEDRVDTLFKEIELAIKWQRPSILLAIYGSEYVYSDAATSLENQLRGAGRQVEHIHGRDGAALDIVQSIGATEDLDNTIFFVDGLRWASRGDSWGAYRSLNQSREFFVAHRIRIVFWLTEDEASSLARYAPDYWAFRHRVVEFIESPEPEQILLRALQSTWQIAGEDTDTYEDPDGKIALRYAMLEELPNNTESTGMRANLLLSLGILHWRKGILDKAARLLNEALGIAITVGEPWLQAACYNAIAIVQADQGLIDDAIASYQKAIELTPNEIFPWNNLGNLYERLNRCEEAIAAFEQALANNERDALAWNGLGNVYLRQQRTADAISAYNKAITISPDFAYPWNGLGNAFASMGDFDAAIGAYQAAVELNKDFPTPWVNLGDIFQEQGNNQDALKAYWNAVRIDSKNAQIWNSLGNAYFFSGQYEESIQAYLKAIKLNRGQEVSYRNLAVAYARIGRHEESMACYQKSLELGAEEPQQPAGQRPLNQTYQELSLAAAIEAEAQTAADAPDLPAEPAEEPIETLLATLSAELAVTDEDAETDQPDLDVSDALEAEEDLPLIETPYPLDGLQPFVTSAPIMASLPPAPAESAALDAMIEEVIVTPAQPETADAVPALAWQTWAPEAELLNPEAAQAPVASLAADEVAPELVQTAQAQAVSAAVVETDNTPTLSEQIERLQRDALVWNELGNVFFNVGEYDEAIKAYKYAIELDPTFGWGYSNLALCYSLTGRIEQARPLYEKIINLLDSPEGERLSWHGTGSNRRPDYNDAGSLRRITETFTPRIEPQSEMVRQIAIESIYTNPYQPRIDLDIDDLVESVREHGIIQPLVVTPNGVPGKYLLVAGERRLEAARQAGLVTVPAIVREASERERAQFSIIENIQRVALTPLELAEAYLRLSEEFHLSHEEIAARVGKPIESITSTLRLLKLSDKAKLALIENRITEAHARALLALSTPMAQNAILAHILSEGLTVEQTVELVRRSVNRKTATLPEDFDLEPVETVATRTPAGQTQPDSVMQHAHLMARARSVLQSNPTTIAGVRGYVYRHAR